MTGYAVLCEERKKKVNRNKTAIEEFAGGMSEINQTTKDNETLEHEFYKALKEDSQYDINEFKNDLEEQDRVKQLLMVVKSER